MPHGSPPSSTAGSRGEPAPGTRCVLWHPEHAVPPEDILAGLLRRNVEVALYTDSFTAFAEVCRLERSLNLAEAANPADAASLPAVVLLIVSPAELPDAPEVVDLMGRYAPRTACWWYSEGANPKLRPVGPDDTAAWSGPAPALDDVARSPMPVGFQNGARAAPRLRLTTEDVQPTGGDHRADGPVTPSRISPHPAPPAMAAAVGQGGERAAPLLTQPLLTQPLLTQEELAMLLADDELPADPAGSARAGMHPPRRSPGGFA